MKRKASNPIRPPSDLFVLRLCSRSIWIRVSSFSSHVHSLFFLVLLRFLLAVPSLFHHGSVIVLLKWSFKRFSSVLMWWWCSLSHGFGFWGLRFGCVGRNWFWGSNENYEQRWFVCVWDGMGSKSELMWCVCRFLDNDENLKINVVCWWDLWFQQVVCNEFDSQILSECVRMILADLWEK